MTDPTPPASDTTSVADDAPSAPSEATAGPSWVRRAGLGAVAVVSLVYGYDFGDALSGPWLGVLTAVSTAVFAVLLIDSLLDLATPRRAR
jgi:hypothetical protein